MTTREPLGEKPVGAADMEAEHQVLHDTLHELQRALEAGRSEDVVELLRRFQDVARLHFMEEQSLMRLHAYPGYAEHQQEHDDLVAELEVLSRGIEAGELADTAQATSSLEKWLLTHMQTADAALETYLENEGIRGAAD